MLDNSSFLRDVADGARPMAWRVQEAGAKPAPASRWVAAVFQKAFGGTFNAYPFLEALADSVAELLVLAHRVILLLHSNPFALGARADVNFDASCRRVYKYTA
jgi:hypothetical protein